MVDRFQGWVIRHTLDANGGRRARTARVLGARRMAHTRGAPYHPQTQDKIERYHRTMENVVKLQHYYFPWELEAALRNFVAYYNNERYHDPLDNVTPADAYFGRRYEVVTLSTDQAQLRGQRRPAL